MAEQQPRWPSVEEQLRRAGARPGSALEQLILANQELEMLRPDEANDKLQIPPWLRVHWRKQHPDAEFAPPSAGYPLTLKELYEWMKDHQDLPVHGGGGPDGRSPAAGRDEGPGEGGHHAE